MEYDFSYPFLLWIYLDLMKCYTINVDKTNVRVSYRLVLKDWRNVKNEGGLLNYIPIVGALSLYIKIIKYSHEWFMYGCAWPGSVNSFFFSLTTKHTWVVHKEHSSQRLICAAIFIFVRKAKPFSSHSAITHPIHLFLWRKLPYSQTVYLPFGP